MSREWSSHSTSKFAHRAPKSLHLLPSRLSLDTQAAPEEDSDIDHVGVGRPGLRNVPGIDMTPHLSSAHFARDPDPYYPPSSYPLMPQSMYTGRQSTDATTSDSYSRDRHVQYATLRLPEPSTPALPSAIFSSAIGSVPPTATTAEFPPRTSGLSVSSYYYGASVDLDTDLSLAGALKSELQPQAYKVSSSQQSSRIEPTLLSNYPRARAGIDSQLGPAQVAQPPSSGEVERFQIRHKQFPLLRPPRSPVYEESDVQGSPVSPVRMQTSHLFNAADPFHDLTDNEAVSMNHHKDSESSEERHFNLMPPTIELPDGTSLFRHSFQTYATVGSTAHGGDGPSLPPTPTSMQFHDQGRWAEVIQSINNSENKARATDSINSNGDRASVEALSSTRDTSSPNASQLRFGNSQGRSNSSLLPPPLQGSSSDGLLTSASMTSGTDSFTAFELMSFPKPPTAVPEQQVSATPRTRSPWVKGITLPMHTNMAVPRRSFREPGTPTALPLSFASVPAPPLPLESSYTPSTPISVPGFNPTFHVVKTPSRVVVATHDSPVPVVAITEGKDSWWPDSRSPSPPSRAASPPLRSSYYLGTPSARSSVDGSTTAKSVAPSYDRRISALIHATEQLVRPSQDSTYEIDTQVRVSEDGDQLGALNRPSEDEPAAVVGIVRTASLSWRSKATLTRAPSSGALAAPPTIQVHRTASIEVQPPIENTVAPLRLKTEDSVLQQGVHAYLSKLPSPSSTVTAASPSGSTPTTLKLSPSLRRQPPVREPGSFPENVDEVDDQALLVHDVNRTGWGTTSFDIRGVDTQMGPKVEMQPYEPLYKEKDLPRVPYHEPRESSTHDRPLPPVPLPLPPLPLPTVPSSVVPSTDDQSQPGQGSSQLRRQESFGSETLTRVSSLLSRLSKSTMHSPTNMSRQSTRKSRRGTVIPPPLPPPPLPLPLTPSQMQFLRFRERHPDEGMADHELMERAGNLERMAQDSALPWESWDQRRNLPAPNPPLDEAYLYHQQIPRQQAQSSSGKGYVHKSALSKANSIRSMFSNRSDRSRHRTPNHAALGSSGVNMSMSGDSNGWFTQLDDEEKRKRDWQMRALAVDPRRPHKVELGPGPDMTGRNAGGPSPRRKQSTRSKWIAGALLLLAVIGLVVGLAVILTRSTSNNQAVSCTEADTTGRLCDIDKTCVCTSNVSGQCNGVARTIVNLIPRMNTLFSVNFTAPDVSLVLWDLLGEPPNDCSKQALLIDVAPGLAVSSSPNRTEFARSAILYSLMETESLNITEQMRSFVANANFSKLAGQDGPVQDDRKAVGLTFGADGFFYDFANMAFRPMSISWKDNSQATGDQINRVDSVAGSVLDRMYSFSTASSTQRSTALQRYWTSVLQLPSNQLDTFLNALRDAPIVLPFDATSDSVSNLMSSSTTTSFPPPAACYPGLSGVNRADIDTVETNAFGLPSSDPVTSANFTIGCFTGRPTYGILNVLNLRLPFADSRQGLVVQASQLTKPVGPRAVLKAGEQLVGLARASASSPRPNTPISASNADPREYGTLLHLNHVALAYLQSFPTAALAATTAQFIMSSPRLPPSNDSSLFLDTNSLLDIPIIEVSVFGQLLPADMDLFYSDFTGPQGQLFFGTQRGDVFRTWALNDSSDTLLWSTEAIARTVIREARERYSVFEDVWQATLKGNLTTPDSVVRALTSAGLFGS